MLFVALLVCLHLIVVCCLVFVGYSVLIVVCWLLCVVCCLLVVNCFVLNVVWRLLFCLLFVFVFWLLVVRFLADVCC